MEQMDIKQMLKRVACAALAVIMAAGAAVCGASVDAEAAVGRKEYKEISDEIKDKGYGDCMFPSYMQYDHNNYIEYKPGYFMSEDEYKRYNDKSLNYVPAYAAPDTETNLNEWYARTGSSYKKAETKLKNDILDRRDLFHTYDGVYPTYKILETKKATNPVLKKKCKWKRIENIASEVWELEHHKKLYAWTYPGQCIPNIPSKRLRNKKKPLYYYYQNTCTTKGFEKWLPAQKGSLDKSDFDTTHAVKVKVSYIYSAEDNLKIFKKNLKKHMPSDNTYINLNDGETKDIAETLHKLLYRKKFPNGHLHITLDYKYDNPTDVNNAKAKVRDIEDYLLDKYGATPFADLIRNRDSYSVPYGITTGICDSYTGFFVDPTRSTVYCQLWAADESGLKKIDMKSTYRYCVDHPDFMQSDQKGFFYTDVPEDHIW